MFQVSLHPSSRVHKTITTAFGTDHIVGAATSFQLGHVAAPEYEAGHPINRHVHAIYSAMALQPNAGHRLLILDEVSRSHTTTHHNR